MLTNTISTTIEECCLLTFPKKVDERGNLSFIEGQHIPFEIKRIFYLYDIPENSDRGAHAHRDLKQCIICLNGGFSLQIDDAQNKKAIRLTNPWQGVYIPPLIWVSIGNFKPNTICLVLASDIYLEEDYYRDYSEFLAMKNTLS